MKLTHAVLFASLLVAPLASAQQAVSWSDFTKIVKDSEADRSLEYTVITKSGVKQKTRKLPMLQHDQIEEIQIRHRGRMSYFGWILNDRVPCEDDGCMFNPLRWPLLPLDVAFGAVTTPPMIAVEGMRRLFTPVKVYRIVP